MSPVLQQQLEVGHWLQVLKSKMDVQKYITILFTLVMWANTMIVLIVME